MFNVEAAQAIKGLVVAAAILAFMTAASLRIGAAVAWLGSTRVVSGAVRGTKGFSFNKSQGSYAHSAVGIFTRFRNWNSKSPRSALAGRRIEPDFSGADPSIKFAGGSEVNK